MFIFNIQPPPEGQLCQPIKHRNTRLLSPGWLTQSALQTLDVVSKRQRWVEAWGQSKDRRPGERINRKQCSHSWLHCYESGWLYRILLAAHSLFTSARKCPGHVRGHSSIAVQITCTKDGFIILLMCPGMWLSGSVWVCVTHFTTHCR